MYRTQIGPEDRMYDVIKEEIKNSVRCRVLSVERIRNPGLSRVYEAKKQVIVQANGAHIMNERSLYHGTSAAAAEEITHYGFNRNYCDPLAAYGRVVYFASEPSLSAYKKYAKVAEDGTQTLIRTRVLSGIFKKLREGDYKEPPLLRGKNGRYDAVSDHPQHPKIFAIYNDAQALPEYIIKIKKY